MNENNHPSDNSLINQGITRLHDDINSLKNIADNEIQRTQTVKAAIHSSKLITDSNYMHLLFNIILVITIICILLYYLFNKKNDLMSTGLSIVLSLIILYIICKYIYDNYINVAKKYY